MILAPLLFALAPLDTQLCRQGWMLCQPETEIHFVEDLEQTNKEELTNDRMFNYKSVGSKKTKMV